jgi:hypothetical protein
MEKIKEIRNSLADIEEQLNVEHRELQVPKSLKYPTFSTFSRQDKSISFIKALQENGYRAEANWRSVSFILSDHDQGSAVIQAMKTGKPIFLHPHSARSMIMWDGIFKPSSFVRCNFVFAEGHKEVMRLYGYSRPVEVIGWSYSPIFKYRPSKEVKRILFAPIHPNRSATKSGQKLASVDLSLNRKAYEILKSIPGIELTVRYFGSLSENGLPEREQGINYSVAELSIESSLRELKMVYDVVVAHQTFAYLAIALGIPTVMFGEDVIPHSVDVKVKSWERYKDILKYPLDLLSDSPIEVLERAISSEEEILEWRKNFIGDPFDGNLFVQKLENYL